MEKKKKGGRGVLLWDFTENKGGEPVVDLPTNRF